MSLKTLLAYSFFMSVIFAPNTMDSLAASSEPAKEEKQDAEKAAETTATKDVTEEGEDVVEELDPKLYRVKTTYFKLPKGKHQPWKLLRSLQHLQDDIAVGKPDSLQAYRVLLEQASNWMLMLPNAVWQCERNLDAVAVYLLIGGNPEIGFKALQKSRLTQGQKVPLRAAISYTQRDLETAMKLMETLDHTILPLSASAQFALAKSMIISSSDIKMAKSLIDEARRLAPGTLIEEAALRRAIRISGEEQNADDFLRLSHTYINRFRDSAFFKDFLKNFVFALVRMPVETHDTMMKEVKQLAAILPDEQQIVIASYLARNATVNARTELAKWAGNLVMEKTSSKSKLHTRMALYSAAAGIVDKERMEDSTKMLTGLNEKALDRNDKKLLEAVNSIAKRMMSEPLQPRKVKQMLREDDQVYPDDEPSLPAIVKDQMPFVDANPTVQKADRLFTEFKNILGE